jgi:hypothetical protein
MIGVRAGVRSAAAGGRVAAPCTASVQLGVDDWSEMWYDGGG